jgi:hypothetical protein
MTLTPGTMPGGQAGQRVVRALATNTESPGKLAIHRVCEHARLPDDQALLRLLWRLENAGWIHRDQVSLEGRPNVVRLTDNAARLCRALGWDKSLVP